MRLIRLSLATDLWGSDGSPQGLRVHLTGLEKVEGSARVSVVSLQVGQVKVELRKVVIRADWPSQPEFAALVCRSGASFLSRSACAVCVRRTLGLWTAEQRQSGPRAEQLSSAQHRANRGGQRAW